MNIIGISGQDRNASAALVRDGAVVAAIEEEKLSRVPNVGMAYCGGLPYQAIEFCLDRGSISSEDIDYVAYYTRPYKALLRSADVRILGAMLKPGIAAGGSLPGFFVDRLAGLRQHSKTRHRIESAISRRARFVAIDHQACHAASAFYPSAFDSAAIVAAGNLGDLTSMALMVGQGSKVTIGATVRFPHSLGMVYTAVTSALGFGAGRENKTMWLALTGENEFDALFRDLIQVDRQGLPYINQTYFKDVAKGTPALSDFFYRRTGHNGAKKNLETGSWERNIACSMQRRVEDVMCEVAARHRERTRIENLCLAGGLALNTMANSAVEQRAGYKSVFVEPVAGNAGCSTGAALYVWHHLLGHERASNGKASLLLGPGYDDEFIKPVLDNCKLDYKYFLTEDRQSEEIAAMLAKGRIVGWFRGPMEFGPRALGARCILASPATEIMRENLNEYIKHRESFRPFPAAVPEERLSEFFEPSALTEFLQGVSRVKPEKKSAIPAAVFGDGVARVHSVSRRQNPTFWKLLMKFGERTGTPVLLSTSFNLFGEPFVCSPREAVRGFYSSGIDCLAIGNFLVEK